VGITTVSGKPQERAALADAVCRAAGRSDIPIHAGIDRSMLGGIVQPECPQAAALPHLSHRPPDDFEPYSAVAFARKLIRSRPGEITLLGIGPLTNLGALFAMDPELPALLRSIVLMCGCFFEPRAYSVEWNARLDPTATAIVYRALAREHRSVGLDVTMQCTIPADRAIARCRELGGPLAAVATMGQSRQHDPKSMVFHDPLAGLSLFDRSVCEWEAGEVTVELASSLVAGMTHFAAAPTTPGSTARHYAARRVAVDRFFASFFGVFEQ
jgi:inosine-uridine nucleoside N-ribohydrolase